MDHYEHHVSVETVMGYNKASSLSGVKKLVVISIRRFTTTITLGLAHQQCLLQLIKLATFW